MEAARLKDNLMDAMKPEKIVLLVWRLVAWVCAPGDKSSRDVPTPRGAWRQGVTHQAINPATMGL
ncbi:hypothetical protein DEO72_LG4g245 [Vigna unguiculata]|uniref:Uncharacterized protein n=1 Tax=Vigna unguiculata TaxID=3917 RepID=A0A4D6LL45_VIGUN|nr:hypothetical protein DEO72_LG4g245 [Vigna unguiculata]